MELKDADGTRLETGFYLIKSAGSSYDICFVDLHSENNSFTIETKLDGFLPITDFEGAATNLRRLASPLQNSRFVDQTLDRRVKQGDKRTYDT